MGGLSKAKALGSPQLTLDVGSSVLTWPWAILAHSVLSLCRVDVKLGPAARTAALLLTPRVTD